MKNMLHRYTYPNFQSKGLLILLLLFPSFVYASGGSEMVINFLWIAILLLFAKFASLVEKWKQPAVLGELIIGVIIGNLTLVGFGFFESIETNHIILFLAELGVVILLFQIGLESHIDEMLQVGWRAFLVAVIGVVTPFALGYFSGMLLMPGESTNAYLFLGATLTATSVGITGRVFKDLGQLDTREAKIVLGAAVIDDVMGLIILAVISAIVVKGVVTAGEISWITGQALVFLVGALFLGQLLAPKIGWVFSNIHTGIGMKFTLAISFCLLFAYSASLVGLAPIVGAFAAGLMLEHVHFQDFDRPQVGQDIRDAVKETNKNTCKKVDAILCKFENQHIDRLIEPLGHFLIPIFFVVTGMQVDLATLADPKILVIAFIVTLIAFAGKLVAGIAAGSANKWIVGWGMVPRGEVGLIFAIIGKQLNVISEEMFSVIIIMVILTTLLTPPILNYLLRKQAVQQS